MTDYIKVTPNEELYSWSSTHLSEGLKIDNGKLWFNNPILSCRSEFRWVEDYATFCQTSPVCVTSIHKLRFMKQSRHSSSEWNIKSNIRYVELADANVDAYFIETGKKSQFIISTTIDMHELDSIDLYEYAHKCKIMFYHIVGGNFRLISSNKWNELRMSCNLAFTELSTISLHVSSFSLREGCRVLSYCAAGIYGILYMSRSCALFIDRSTKSAQILPITYKNIEEKKKFCLMIGYLSEDCFSVLRCKVGNTVLDMTSTEVERLQIDVDHGVEFSVKACNLDYDVEDKWRACYVGSQRSIMLTKRASNLSNRELSSESVLNIIHKLICASLVEAFRTGLDMKVLIKSRPFEFFRSLCEVSECVFIHYESWDEDEVGASDIDKLSDYSMYEPVMDIMEYSSFTQIMLASSKAHPIIYRSEDLIKNTNQLKENYILLDFNNQNLIECEGRCKYIGVVNDSLKCRLDDISWSVTDRLVELSLDGTDLLTFCESTNQSLNDVNILVSQSLQHYVNM